MSELPDPGAKAQKKIGDFEIIGTLGKGAMGAVFKARQKSLDRIVALKVLPPRIAKDKSFIERFVREARASAKLTHPNVVAGIAVGQDPATDLWYFAMEFIDGPTSRQLLKEKGRLPEDQALKIGRDIAEALECAHQNRIVHRDVKPDNILLTRDGTAKLADLGLVRHQQDDAGLTQSGAAVGTPFYMSPEQVRGQLDQMDTRTDLYGLGATLFHLVTGQPPFSGATSAVIMAKHLSDPPPMAHRVCPDVSPACSKLIQKLLQKEKTQRTQTPKELIQQIERILRLPAPARGQTTGPRLPVKGATTTAARIAVRPHARSESRSTSRSAAALYTGLGAGAVLLLGLVALFSMSRTPPATRAHQEKREPRETTPPTVLPTNARTNRPHIEQAWRQAQAFAKANRCGGQFHKFVVAYVFERPLKGDLPGCLESNGGILGR